eukprot:357005-Chlamydomonas_euryale.AAC.8
MQRGSCMACMLVWVACLYDLQGGNRSAFVCSHARRRGKATLTMTQNGHRRRTSAVDLGLKHDDINLDHQPQSWIYGP